MPLAKRSKSLVFLRFALVSLGVSLAGACSGTCGDSATEPVVVPTSSSDAALVPTPPLPPLVKDPETDAAADANLADAGPRELRGGTDLASRLRLFSLARGKRPDCVEIRPARPDDDPKSAAFRAWNPGSQGIAVAAIGVFHAAFAKAHPGFELGAPVKLTEHELQVLANELSELSMQLLAATDLATAKSRWGKGSSFIGELESEADWKTARPVLAESARALAAKVKAHADVHDTLWFLAF
jgi:hypothetical protein